jgi:hypothetical protein
MTLDGWTGIMYNLMYASDLKILPVVYCTSIVFVCSFFLVNLLLAVMMESYSLQDERFNILLKQKLNQERLDLQAML